MEPKTAADYRNFAGFVPRQTGRLYATVIRRFAESTVATRAFTMIALGVSAGTTLWTLAASSILNQTQR